MDFLLDPEQQQVEDAVLDLLAGEFPLSRMRAGATDTDRWAVFVDMGWVGLALPEELGGSGLSVVEAVLLQRAAGRHLLTPSLAASMVAASAAAAAGNADLARALAGGAARAAFAVAAEQPDGTRHLFIDAEGATHVLLAGEGGPALYDARSVQSGSHQEGLDDALSLHSGTLDGDPLVPASGAFGAELNLLLSAYLSGIAEAARDMAVEYAKTRVQFGQPIGAFQAIKHHCANMAIKAEAAWAQTIMATLSVQQGLASAPAELAAAAWITRDAAIANGSVNIQVHGGIGFTWEADPHRLLKRSWLIAELAADSGAREQLLAQAAE